MAWQADEQTVRVDNKIVQMIVSCRLENRPASKRVTGLADEWMAS